MPDEILTESPMATGKKKAAKEETMTVTRSELAAMVQDAVASYKEQASGLTAKELAAALREANEPYVSPAEQANREMFRLSQIEQEKRKKLTQRTEQRNCPHRQGALGDRMNGYSSFWMIRYANGLQVGVCSCCQKRIYSDRPEDAPFFRIPAANRIAIAGATFVPDPMQSQKDSRPIDWNDRDTSPVPVVA